MKDAKIFNFITRPFHIFLFFLIAYFLTWGGHYTSGDGAQKVALTKAMLFRHSFDIDPGPAVVYSIYGIGHSLIAILAIIAAHIFKSITGTGCEGPIYTSIFIVNGAWFLYLVASYLKSHYSWKRVFITTLILGFATTWWPYTKLDFSEPLVTTFLFWGFLCVRSGSSLLGILVASISFLIKPEAIILVFVLIVWRIFYARCFKELLKMGLGLTPSLVTHFLVNYLRGSLLGPEGYSFSSSSPFANPWWVGLYGILLSAGKSIFLFSPPLIIGCCAWKNFFQTTHGKEDAIFFLAIFLAQLATYSAWWDWSGDDSWGVRFLIPSVMLMAIPIIEFLNKRFIVLWLSILGLGVQLLAVLVGGLDYLLIAHQQPLTRKALYVEGYNRIDFEDIRYNPNYSQLAGNWILLKSLLMSDAHSQRNEEDTTKVGTSLENTLSPEEWKKMARWDFVWNIKRKNKSA